jgi:hypothetical protein
MTRNVPGSTQKTATLPLAIPYTVTGKYADNLHSLSYTDFECFHCGWTSSKRGKFTGTVNCIWCGKDYYVKLD